MWIEVFLTCGGIVFLLLALIITQSHNHIYSKLTPRSRYDALLGWKFPLKALLPRPTAWSTLAAIVWQSTASLYCIYHRSFTGWALFTSIDVCLWKHIFRRRGPYSAWGTIPGADLTALGEATTHEKRDSLRIMSYNLFLRSPCTPDTTFFSEEYKDERLDDFLRQFAEAQARRNEPPCDVICFQEVFTFGQFRQERLLAGLRDLGFTYYARPDVHRPLWNLKQWVDSGLLTVSRLPITAMECDIFHDLQGGCQFTAKGFLYTELQYTDGSGLARKIHLCNAHTQSSKTVPVPAGVVPAPHPEAEYRRRNLQQIRQCLAGKIDPDAAHDVFILAGDLNIDSRMRVEV